MAKERAVIAQIDRVAKRVVLRPEDLDLVAPQTFKVHAGETVVWKLVDTNGQRRDFAARVSFDILPETPPLFKERSVFTADGDTITSDTVNPDAPALRPGDDPILYRYLFELDILGQYEKLECFWQGEADIPAVSTGMGGGVKSGGPGG